MVIVHIFSPVVIDLSYPGIPLNWQDCPEYCISRHRFNQKLPLMPVHDDVMRDMQSQASSRTWRLGRKEWLKDSVHDVPCDTGTVILDFDIYPIVMKIGSQINLAFPLHGINRIINDIGPDLVQLARIGLY